VDNIFIELYLDENVSVLVAKILRARGYKVITTDEVGRKGTSDTEQLQYAVENGFAIASLNRVDFEALASEYFSSGKHHYGIFIVADNSPQVIAQRLSDHLDRITADEAVDQIIYI
jgi:predicted nuclease of predicted toxin-antitoxin system